VHGDWRYILLIQTQVNLQQKFSNHSANVYTCRGYTLRLSLLISGSLDLVGGCFIFFGTIYAIVRAVSNACHNTMKYLTIINQVLRALTALASIATVISISFFTWGDDCLSEEPTLWSQSNVYLIVYWTLSIVCAVASVTGGICEFSRTDGYNTVPTDDRAYFHSR
jgi:hypothetical protein